MTDIPEISDLKVKDIFDTSPLLTGRTETETTSNVGEAPIGAVMPWLKTLAGTPTIPANWMECDGSTISDSSSPMNGTTIPDLNGDNRFLRGNSTSGGTGGSSTHTLITNEIPVHNHPPDTNTHFMCFTSTGGSQVFPGAGSDRIDIRATTGNAGSGQPHENKPPYYDVVWIIRFK